MGAGIPMYYLTAHSRAQSAGKGYSRVATDHAGDEGGLRATLTSELRYSVYKTDSQRHGPRSRTT